TEVTIGCIAQYIEIKNLEAYKTRPTIGKPIYNTKAYILDKNQNPQPHGITGELVLSGAGVAKGYFKRGTLTAEKFIPNTLLEKEEALSPYDRLYRTGDLARQLADGKLEFLGRIDHQVKIRGYRIELGEIENRLLEHEEIKEAAVLIFTSEKGDKYLCAYIVATGHDRNGAHVTAGDRELKEYLSLALPEYMIPGYYVYLENLPLTPNGKLDRNALPLPQLDLMRDYIAPRDHIEETMVNIWSDVLELEKEKISIYDNFFHLGGHSLKAVVMVSKLHQAFNVNVPLAEIFKNPDINGLALYIKEAEQETFVSIEPAEKKEYYQLSPPQRRMYILQQMEPRSTVYNISDVIPTGENRLEKENLENILRKLVHRHESLRTTFFMQEEQPVQCIHDTAALELKVEYYETTGARNPETGNGEKGETGTPVSAIIKNFVRPFDLSQAPLIRIGLLNIKTNTRESETKTNQLLLLDRHHIISDGVSRGILRQDFMRLLRNEELPGLQLQYKDYSEWHNRERLTQRLTRQETYWLERFDEEIPVLNLPTDFQRPAFRSFEGSSIRTPIPPHIFAVLKETALKQGVTNYMVLLALFNILMTKISGQEDVVKI
ncbi:MAG: AMP-binding protein, partial [bacterium]|nr:AMP-binding protein [bacterium]